mgnify:FL=1|tara:strand:- start:171 stop:605 length:435 start_codon:yes stop_codon:yes gene_type:complete
MQLITSEISDKTVTKLNSNANLIEDLLHYYGRWEGFNKNNKQYTSAVVKKVTNTGMIIEVDGTDVDIIWKWKYSWIFSALNQDTNVTVAPVSDEIVKKIDLYVNDAQKVSIPKWKTMTKQYYTNGHGGETFQRYNSYNGSKTNF